MLRRRRRAAAEDPLAHVDPGDRAIVAAALPHTMTGATRLQALVDAVRHCEARGLPGAFAECGVWRGGSVLAAILTLQALGAERDLWLYDTFEGMTAPTEHDVSAFDPPARETYEAALARGETPWPELFGGDDAGEAAVRARLEATGYPPGRLHLVKGPVEQTIPGRAPEQLALLRLDTDWYESTRHELEHLWPRLVPGGVLIVDDYGHWQGARRAVDEFFGGSPPLLQRVDYTCRMAVKA
jgi:O-methyltransferase